MTNTFSIPVAVAVALACASTAGAQQAEPKTFAKPAVDAASCADVVWQKEILAQYPNIAAACQEVVVSNDARFARFSGELVQVNRDGSVRFEFEDREGHSIGKPTTLQPAPTQRVLIEGRRYKFSELVPGQKLNIYVPEAGLAVATELGVPPASMARMVFDESDAPANAPGEPVRLAEAAPQPAQATPQPAEAQPERLPDTAGWSPLLAFAGVLALGGGIALTARRRLRKPVLA
jgi:hypothetical protein